MQPNNNGNETNTGPDEISNTQQTESTNYKTPAYSAGQSIVGINQKKADQELRNSNKTRRLVLSISLLAAVVLVSASAWLVWSDSTEDTSSSELASSESSDNDYAESSHSTTPEREKDADFQALSQIDYDFFMPRNYRNATEMVFYGDKAEPSKSFLTTGINIQYGSGIIRGSYLFHSYPATEKYNPPETCPLFGGWSDVNLPCEKYERSGEIEAYINRSPMPGSVQNTAVDQYINMFGKIGNSVVLIEAADTSEADLYEMLKNVQLVKPTSLPSNAEIVIYPFDSD